MYMWNVYKEPRERRKNAAHGLPGYSQEAQDVGGKVNGESPASKKVEHRRLSGIASDLRTRSYFLGAAFFLVP